MILDIREIWHSNKILVVISQTLLDINREDTQLYAIPARDPVTSDAVLLAEYWYSSSFMRISSIYI